MKRPSTFQVYAAATLVWTVATLIVALTGFSNWYITLGACVTAAMLAAIIAYEEYHGELMSAPPEATA